MLTPAHKFRSALAFAAVLALSAPAAANDKPAGAHAITGAVIKINGKTADGVLADLPPGPSAPKNRGPGANAMSLDDANGHEKAPKPRPKPGSGINETITVHGARTENGTPFDYPGVYAQRFDGANRAPAAPQTSVSKFRTTPLWGVRHGR